MPQFPADEPPVAAPNVAGAYDRWAAQYDDNHNLTRDLDAVVVRRAPLHVSGRDVLELGCGTGKNTIWLASKARALVAMDFSSGMLDAARRRAQAANTRFVQHDVRETWPVADCSMDV
ncbi:MAG: class I SAM-dependent methyltransferase, partial [bacterium]